MSLLVHAFSLQTVVQSYSFGGAQNWELLVNYNFGSAVPAIYVDKAAPDAVISLAVAGRRLNLFVMFYIFVFL